MITGPFTFIGELSCNFSFFSKNDEIYTKHGGIQLRRGFLYVNLFTGFRFMTL